MLMFKILVLNIGSTSLKFSLFDMDEEKMIAKGNIENIGDGASPMTFVSTVAPPRKMSIDTRQGYGVGVSAVLNLLCENGDILRTFSELKAIGFKAVHAGELTVSSLITDRVLNKMEDYSCVVPAHNPPYLNAIRQCRDLFPRLPLVAVFETDFHKDMPDYARTYSIPFEWYKDYGIRRFGFHGSSHRYVAQRAAHLLNRPLDQINIISCHLGGSSSITAIKKGKSIDQSMGFSAQAGVAMATRCGDIDPFIIPYIMKKTGLNFEEVISTLANQSGLLGISGVSGDMRKLEDSYEKCYRARLAFDIFCYGVKKYIGSYMVVLEGADVLVFTGGIGENSALVRQHICDGLKTFGFELDKTKNATNRLNRDRCISKAQSKNKIMVIAAKEELVVARETAKVLRTSLDVGC